VTREALREQFREHDVFNTLAFCRADTGEFILVAQDVVDYCRGAIEGTDLQLSDSHDLPNAQAIAEELEALEQGYDEDGLPYGPDDRQFFPIPRLGGSTDEEVDAAINDWLSEFGLDTAPVHS
jgi:hypothetical protein